MKTFLKTIIILFVIQSVPFSQEREFTTLCLSNGYIFAGVKTFSFKHGMHSYLLQVSSQSLKSSKVTLPLEISDREIRSIFSANDNTLIILSQWTIENGDNPLFYSYNIKSKKWNKLAEINCISFDRVTISKNTLTFSCYESCEDGNEIVVKKPVTLPGVIFDLSGETSTTVDTIKTDSLQAELIGNSFDWQKFRISNSFKSKLFQP